MFFIMGIDPRKKQLTHNQLVICGNCGKYGRYEVWLTYMCFSFFFVPILKWNKRYIVRMNCCGAMYELDPAIGRSIARGAEVEILPEHLEKISDGTRNVQGYKRCSQCGYEAAPDFQFCPKCGNPLE